MAITALEFRQRLVAGDMQTLEDELFAPGALHVGTAEILYVGTNLAAAYSVADSEVTLHVVGSAKLGFAIAEKRLQGGGFLPRYRPFGPYSDIDIAVISPPIFNQIWHELALHVNEQPWMPTRLGTLGDYLVYGWLRPDKFPRRLLRCDLWWDTFHRLSAEARFGRPVRGALFYSDAHMKMYYARAVRDCRRAEGIP